MTKRQFGLFDLFAATTLFCVLFAIFGLSGRAAVWVLVQLCATGAIVASTGGRTWRGAKVGFVVGACVAGMLLLTQEFRDTAWRGALLLWMGTFGAWVGAAAHGIAADNARCVIALLAAFLWAMAVLGSM